MKKTCLLAAAVAILLVNTVWSAELNVSGYAALVGGGWPEGLGGGGALQVVQFPAKVTTTLDRRVCMGPGFSPDGSRIAYSCNNKIMLINRDGTGLDSINVACPTDRAPNLTWITVNGSDYLYWSERSPYIFRLKLGTTIKDTVHRTPLDIAFCYCNVSRDGLRAGCTRSNVHKGDTTRNPDGSFKYAQERVLSGWAPIGVIIGSRYFNQGEGCQGSISGSGKYLTQNTGLHQIAHMNPFDTMMKYDGDGATKVPTGTKAQWTITTDGGAFVGHRYSHHSDYYVMFRTNMAYLCDVRTDEKVALGPGVAWDFFPAATSGADTSVKMPAIMPAGGNFYKDTVTVSISCATTGVSIYYTPNGADPTRQSALYTGPFKLTMESGVNLTVLARAYKASTDSSPIAVAIFRYDAGSFVTLTSPKGGTKYSIGQTITFTWTNDNTMNDADINCSPDNGKTWVSLMDGGVSLTSGDPRWQKYPWVIPKYLRYRELNNTLDSFSLAGRDLLFKIHPYMDDTKMSITDGFVQITASAAVARASIIGGRGQFEIGRVAPHTFSISLPQGEMRPLTLFTPNGKRVLTIQPTTSGLSVFRLPRSGGLFFLSGGSAMRQPLRLLDN